ncbi:MAG: phosphotriesterase-related protein [Armatimonadetes bacterium]|nr:phosphotriesterase-related protein [Armatimonadota bacterium]
MTRTIPTVLGEAPVDQLGVVDYHEHLYVLPPAWLHRIDPDFALSDEEKSATELSRWAAAGGRTLVEMTAPDFGRDIEAVRRIAERVPQVYVLVTTGFNRPWYMGRWVYELDEADAIRRAVREITHGVGETGIRAAVIKAGTEYNMLDEPGRKLLRIAAAAHRDTGAPIITHTTAGTMGPEQVAYLSEQGVAPHRICLSHMDRNLDFEVHASLARAGLFLGYDCAGKSKYGPDSARVAFGRQMVHAGYGRQILLGNDLGRPSYWVSYGGGPGLDYVLTRFVPRLREAGVPEDAIRDLLVNNPRRFLGGAED